MSVLIHHRAEIKSFLMLFKEMDRVMKILMPCIFQMIQFYIHISFESAQSYLQKQRCEYWKFTKIDKNVVSATGQM